MMRSMPPCEFATLPALNDPAGYICVIRDVDSDSYRIDRTAAPADLVAEALAQREGDFGLELVTVLSVDDIAAAESKLFDEHYAELGGDWLHLDPYQVQELRASFLQLNAHASHYLSPDAVQQPRKHRGPNRSREEVSFAPLESGEEKPSVPVRQSMSDRLNDFIVHHPGLVICIILLLMFVCLVWLSNNWYCYGCGY